MSKTVLRKITKFSLGELKVGQTIKDTELKSFGARRRKHITFFVRTRLSGKQRWFTIGELGHPWTVALARKEAHRILVEVSQGHDPKQEKVNTKLFGEVAEEFFEKYCPRLKPETFSAYERYIYKYLKPKFGKKDIKEITRGDVSNFHAELSDKKRAANFALAVLSKTFSWAEEQGYRAENSNPCKNISKYPERRRERYLSNVELAKLGQVLDEIAATGKCNLFAVAAIRLIILTGARRNEILTCKWSYIKKERHIIALPDSKTGPKNIPLNSYAIEVLDSLPKFKSNPYVLPGLKEGQRLVNLQKPWSKIRKLADIEDVRIHDLRHSFGSLSVDIGGSLPVLGKVLGHTNTKTTARYAHVKDDPALQLSENVGAIVMAAMRKKPSKTEEESDQFNLFD